MDEETLAEKIFPYDSVYFKAVCYRVRRWQVESFPYDSVYFKADVSKASLEDDDEGFPYDSVYFKAFTLPVRM